MGDRSVVLAASLVLLALLSGVVLAEAEANYQNVTSRDQTTATVNSVDLTDDGVRVVLQVHNSMEEPLRVQYVHIVLDRENATDAASVPYNGYRTLPPGDGLVTGGVPGRQTTGTISEGDTFTVRGTVAVEVYNRYRFEIPVEPTEVTI
jgi:hypothetical protein